MDHNEEIWRAIPSLPGYEASSHGRIRSVDRVIFRAPSVAGGVKRRNWLAGKILIQNKNNKSGRFCVYCGRGTNKPVHRLVAEAFLGPRPDGLEIDHINGNNCDNSASNLRYVTRSINELNKKSRHAYMVPSGKWRARYKYKGNVYYTKCCHSREEAIQLNEIAKANLFSTHGHIY